VASTSPINEVENFAEPHTSMAYKTVLPNPPKPPQRTAQRNTQSSTSYT
jgi:hypothetical protein